MRVYNRLLLSLSAALGFINCVLVFSQQTDLVIYFIANIAVYFTVILFYVNLNSKGKSSLAKLGAVLTAVFLLIFFLQLIIIVK